MATDSLHKACVPDIILLSQLIINRLYEGTLSHALKWLDPDIIWIDATFSQCFYSYSQLLSNVSFQTGPGQAEVRHLQYHKNVSQPDINIVTGRYHIINKAAGRLISCRTHQITLIWTHLKGTPRLIHVHISSPEPAPQISGFLCFHGRKSETYQVLPEEIMYVEAENINCIVHTTSRKLSVCLSIGEIEKQLPDQFLRIHRSFIINHFYVARMYRYAVELSDRTTLPIPEKKYMQIVCEIERRWKL